MVDVDRTMVYHVLGVLQNHGLNPQKDKTSYNNLLKLGPIIKSYLKIIGRNSCYRIKGPDQNLYKIRAYYRILSCFDDF